MDTHELDAIRALRNDAHDGKRLTSTQIAQALDALLAHIDDLEARLALAQQWLAPMTRDTEDEPEYGENDDERD